MFMLQYICRLVESENDPKNDPIVLWLVRECVCVCVVSAA